MQSNFNKLGVALELSKSGVAPSLGSVKRVASGHRKPASFVRPASGSLFNLRFGNGEDGEEGEEGEPKEEDEEATKVKLRGASLTATFPDGFVLATKSVEEKTGSLV